MRQDLQAKVSQQAGAISGAASPQETGLTIKKLFSDEAMKRRFQEILGQKAAGFVASVINATNSNKDLALCDPYTVISAAAVAATLDLPIDQNLGFAAIIPYDSQTGRKAQFQIMYKGFVQLGIRSGQYEDMNVSEVYEDELQSYNPITGEIKFTHMDTWEQREFEDKTKVVGYYAYFKLLNGFKKGVYWTNRQIHAHGKKYSKSYHKPKGKWQTDFEAMAKKTVLKMLLNKWGILSIDMVKAVQADQAVVSGDDKDPNFSYVDNQESGGAIDAEYSEVSEGLEPDPAVMDDLSNATVTDEDMAEINGRD